LVRELVFPIAEKVDMVRSAIELASNGRGGIDVTGSVDVIYLGHKCVGS